MAVIVEDARDLINKERINQGRSLTWMAKELEMNYNTLYSILVQKTITLQDELKDSISKLLGTKF